MLLMTDNSMDSMYTDYDYKHDGVIYTVVARNGWRVYMEFVRGLRLFSLEYERQTRKRIGVDMFKYIVDGLVVDDIESREMYWWCINRKLM